MSREFTPQGASCSCTSNTYTINDKPIGRFICHCRICQEFTGNDFNDVTVFVKSDVSDLKISTTKFVVGNYHPISNVAFVLAATNRVSRWQWAVLSY